MNKIECKQIIRVAEKMALLLKWGSNSSNVWLFTDQSYINHTIKNKGSKKKKILILKRTAFSDVKKLTQK